MMSASKLLKSCTVYIVNIFLRFVGDIPGFFLFSCLFFGIPVYSEFQDQYSDMKNYIDISPDPIIQAIYCSKDEEWYVYNKPGIYYMTIRTAGKARMVSCSRRKTVIYEFKRHSIELPRS